MGILKIQLTTVPVSLPYNKENHELLVPICRKLARDFEVIKVYLHHNNIYVHMNTTNIAEVSNLCVELGYSFSRAFRKNPGAVVSDITDNTKWELIHLYEAEAAHMLYEEYLEELQASPNLFGADGVIPFEKLPLFFRAGVDFEGSAIDDAVRAAQKASKQMADLMAQFNAIFSPPPGTILPPPISPAGPLKIGPPF